MINGISNKIKYIFFVITYILSCLTISTDKFQGYLGYSDTDKLLIKFSLVFLFVLLAAIINKKQQESKVNPKV